MLNLKEHFNNPAIIEKPGVLDDMIRGMTTQHSQKVDLDYVEDISHHMYGNGAYGFDILSLDIQRGRDHGLPSYTAFRTLCAHTNTKSFGDLRDVMVPEAIQSLSNVYKHVNDVDLLVGGMLETPENGSLLGPTLSCIVADQFKATRCGDRYFYSNLNQPYPFSEIQLKEIEKATLAGVLCENGGIEFMQLDAFQKVSER